MTKNKITIRQLGVEDWEIYRDVRLHALKTEQGNFSSNYEKESAFTKDDWLERIEPEGRAAFCLFEGNKPIGITGAIRKDGNVRSPEVVLVASYILPEYRGRGLSQHLYSARLNWAASQDGVTTVLVSHRESNIVSKRANQAFGFVYQGQEIKQWPNGESDAWLFYALDIRDYKPLS